MSDIPVSHKFRYDLDELYTRLRTNIMGMLRMNRKRRPGRG